jgi:radical SAM protein with 4Fe4S-binding SPASM domain
MRRSLIIDTHASSCYFRTSVGGDGRKALIQITERCNLHCAPCFVSSGDWGEHMPQQDVADKVLPRLVRARVERVTLTGGEPFAHPPNDDKPLAGCDAGKLIYVFADALTAVCPYLVFAARTPQSAYPDSDFLVGNILTGEIAEALDRHDLAGRLAMGANRTCRACAMGGTCGKGCPAALISRGRPIGEVDSEQGPVVASPLLQIGPRPQ